MLKLTVCRKIALSAVFLALSTGSLPVMGQEVNEVEVVEEVDGEIVEIPFYSPEVTDEMIKDRMQCLQNEIHLTYNPQVKSFIDYFSIKNKTYLATMERRRNVYFPIFEEYLKKHNMPDELKYLSIVESGLNPNAFSRVGAAGLWQFMPSTGKMYHLDQDFYIDERLDPYEATEAACKYLKQLYKMFNDWELALASYNCGPGNVRKAIRRSGYKDTFWEIYRYLPRETRGYVPQFIAIMYVMNHLDDYGFQKDVQEYPMAFDTINIQKTIDLNVFCDYLGICRDDISRLNPGLKREIIPGYLNYSLRVPSDIMEAFNSNRLAIMDSSFVEKTTRLAFEESAQPEKIYYKVRNGDYLGKIASKYGVSVSNIKKWNGMRSSTVYVGQRLAIYTRKVTSTTFTEFLAKNDDPQPKSPVSPAKAPVKEASGSETHYTVRSGDNLHKISERYSVTIDDIKKWNNLNSTVIHAGQKLVVRAESSQEVVIKKPNPKVYYVQPGDTLWSISRKYNGLTVDEIKKKNNLKNENIKPGMKLIIG